MKNILFYKYIEIENPKELKNKQMQAGKSLNLLGTILIAKEGINGCVSGEDGSIEEYKKTLAKDSRFSDVKFKEGIANRHTFKKFHVRIRNEIVSSKFNVDIKNKGEYIEPKEFKKLLDNNEDVILLDARNNYEFDVGRFKGAIHLDLDTFREFSLKIKKLQRNNENDNNNKVYNNKNNIKNNNNKNSIKKIIIILIIVK